MEVGVGEALLGSNRYDAHHHFCGVRNCVECVRTAIPCIRAWVAPTIFINYCHRPLVLPTYFVSHLSHVKTLHLAQFFVGIFFPLAQVAIRDDADEASICLAHRTSSGAQIDSEQLRRIERDTVDAPRTGCIDTASVLFG